MDAQRERNVGAIGRALISVSDKSGLLEFAEVLIREFRVQICSTGGTAKVLMAAGYAVTLIDDITGFSEMLDGRVKTLHPKVHAGVLADRNNPEHLEQLERAGIQPIDLVVVNLYPFESTIKARNCSPLQAMEMIDIGGPCLLRAAAKNHEHVWVVCDPSDYRLLLGELRSGNLESAAAFRRRMAQKAFRRTSQYDGIIAEFFARLSDQSVDGKSSHLADGEDGCIEVTRVANLRYGENPHQTAGAWLVGKTTGMAIESAVCRGATVIGARQVSGDELSFNNYADADAALALSEELSSEWGDGSVNCVVFKHGNPCGVGIGAAAIEAYDRAYRGDPNAAMGGVLACGFAVASDFALHVMETYDRCGEQAGAGAFFLDVWLAQMFDESAIETIRRAKNWGQRVRLLEFGLGGTNTGQSGISVRGITAGLLIQDSDDVGLNETQWRVVTGRAPAEREWNDLRLAWLVCKHSKSNAISICRDGSLLGNGAGQTSRVMSCRLATWLACANGHERELKGAAAASDAFFPFRDGPELLMGAGVQAMIQPGGSKRDEETICACDERGVSMVFTGTRHFRH